MLDLVLKTRSFRRFDEAKRISKDQLSHFIDLARLGGSARNQQAWQYAIFNDQTHCEKIFPFIGWAGYLSDWKGPVEGERPSSYIFCLLNRDWLKGSEQEAYFDLGTATQNLLLGAMAQGIGGCRIGAFSPNILELFNLPDHLDLALILALGYPAETIMLSEVTDDDIKYFRNETDDHIVPKRSLSQIIVEI